MTAPVFVAIHRSDAVQHVQRLTASQYIGERLNLRDHAVDYSRVEIRRDLGNGLA